MVTIALKLKQNPTWKASRFLSFMVWVEKESEEGYHVTFATNLFLKAWKCLQDVFFTHYVLQKFTVFLTSIFQY